MRRPTACCRTDLCCRIPLFLAAVLILAAPAGATPYLYTKAYVLYGPPDAWNNGSVNTGSSSASTSGGYNVDTHSYTGAASAQAEYGRLHAFASGSVLDALSPSHLVAGEARFNDDLTFTGGSGNGTVVFRFTVTGSASGSASTYAGIDVSGFTTYFSTGGTYDVGPIPITFDSPAHLLFSLGAYVRADLLPGQSAGGTTDFGNTATLTGITVYQGGVPLPTFGLSTSSGTTYPLPEPATLSLLALGGFPLLYRMRR